MCSTSMTHTMYNELTMFNMAEKRNRAAELFYDECDLSERKDSKHLVGELEKLMS